MSLISIAVGHGGLGIHSALTQYAVDHVARLKSCAATSPQCQGGDTTAIACALERLYFKGDDGVDKGSLHPLSIVMPLGIDLDTFESANSCRRIRNAWSGAGSISGQGGFSERPAGWSYADDSVLNMPGASHDIWSRGSFNAALHRAEICDIIRKYVEETDILSGFLSFGSLGGGSGSGIGSYLSKLFADQYPKTLHVPIAIAPFSHGESGSQSLNMTLALSYYQEYCDGIILLQNDQQQEMCEQLFGGDSTSFNSFNEVCALNLFHGLRPPSSTCPISGGIRFHRPLHYITDGLCSYPSLKILNLHLMPLDRLDGSKNGSENVQQMVNQLADTLKADPTLGYCSTNEKVLFSPKEFTTQENLGHATKSNITSKEQIAIQDFCGYEKTAIKQTEAMNRFKTLSGVPVKSPDCQHIEVTEKGISSTATSGAEVTTASTVSFKLIKTNGKKRTNVTKYNIVAGIQLNIGGPLQESINLVDLYQDVLFWKYSTRPIQVIVRFQKIRLYRHHIAQLMLDLSGIRSHRFPIVRQFCHSWILLRQPRKCCMPQMPIYINTLNTDWNGMKSSTVLAMSRK
ncbi:Tubulin delta chain [Babesia sp. Xinjiang]|uniref:Tubulin delta chain n=1 Tax=Babesia sp. Xinjiang TaxID=462227 RepID=UPI000A25D4B7|nr:Tubulin delta chain [Babesia sp. Xinjiang]ORM42233.1 Tubulin delta chain [Babesia sp. Xinjiang]